MFSVQDKVVSPAFPIAIFGVTALVAATAALLLPETLSRFLWEMEGFSFQKRIGVIWEISRKLPDTVREAEAVNVSIRDGIIRTRVTRW